MSFRPSIFTIDSSYVVMIFRFTIAHDICFCIFENYLKKMQRFFYAVILIFLVNVSSAQDTLLLISGKKIIASTIDLHDNTIAYRKIDNKDALKTIDPDRVFSITYRDGTERIIYIPDSLDPLDFKVEEMRTFIRGVQDAKKVYKNNTIKIAGVGIGGGLALMGFYGLVGPPLYATLVGSYSPDIEKKLTFKVSGSGAESLGISPGKYLNSVTGKTSSPKISKGQRLKIANTTFKFEEDAELAETVNLINSKYKCMRVHAVNDSGKIKLFRTESAEYINVNEYREGFEKKMRDYKIRNAMLSCLAGLIVGGITYVVLE